MMAMKSVSISMYLNVPASLNSDGGTYQKKKKKKHEKEGEN